jgi:ribosomal protein S18 acetylase RimI-like enzyme
MSQRPNQPHPHRHRRASDAILARVDAAHYDVQPMRPEHVSGTAQIVRQAFPDLIWAALGDGVLHHFLAPFAEHTDCFGFVCVHQREVIGFAAGCADSGQLKQALIRRRMLPLARRALSAMVRSPSLLVHMGRYVRPYLQALWSDRLAIVSRRAAPEPGTAPLPEASLVLLGVRAGSRRRGIADRLMAAFLAELRRRGISRAKLTVAADNERAIRLYQRWGWHAEGCYPTPEGGSAFRLVYSGRPVERMAIGSPLPHAA